MVAGTRAIQRMNHENGGFDCPGCAWPDDTKGLHLDICENGIKHVTWEMTRKRVDREFFAGHTVSELSGWTDFALEDQGRLTEPMVYDAAIGQATCRSRGRTRSSWSAPRCAGSTARIRRRSTRRVGSATRRRFCTSCGCASSAPTTCPTARTCATRPAAER